MEMKNQYTINDVVVILNKRFSDTDKRIAEITTTLTKRMDSADKRFENFDDRFESIDDRFENIDKRFESIDENFSNVISLIKKVAQESRDYTNQRLEAQTETIMKVIDDVIGRLDKIEFSVAGMRKIEKIEPRVKALEDQMEMVGAKLGLAM